MRVSCHRYLLCYLVILLFLVWQGYLLRFLFEDCTYGAWRNRRRMAGRVMARAERSGGKEMDKEGNWRRRVKGEEYCKEES